MAENAKPRDVQAGWAVFRRSQYEATLDEINHVLQDRGFNPVSGRTYTHYKKLHRYGYERYVPINQLDVETLRDPVWDTPLRHRYLSRSSDQSVTLVFVRGDVLFLPGQIESFGELEAVIRVADSQLATVGKSGG